MNKKVLFILSFLLMVSFSAGVFVQLLTTDQVSLAAEDLSFWHSLLSLWKNDLTIAIAALLFSLSPACLPLFILLLAGQVFALGFSASWLLSAHPQGFLLVSAILLPRCLIKIPIYVALVFLTAENTKKRRSQKRQKLNWQAYTVCAAVLMLSSLLEAVLHLLTASP